MLFNIIYLDDEPDLCEIFSDEFSAKDIAIITYTSADTAIKAANQNHPDLIFIDYRLPLTNGDEVALAMPPHIPKYLVTGEQNVETKYKFSGVLGKPLDRKKISEVIRNLASAGRATGDKK